MSENDLRYSALQSQGTLNLYKKNIALGGYLAKQKETNDHN